MDIRITIQQEHVQRVASAYEEQYDLEEGQTQLQLVKSKIYEEIRRVVKRSEKNVIHDQSEQQQNEIEEVPLFPEEEREL